MDWTAEDLTAFLFFTKILIMFLISGIQTPKKKKLREQWVYFPLHFQGGGHMSTCAPGMAKKAQDVYC